MLSGGIKFDDYVYVAKSEHDERIIESLDAFKHRKIFIVPQTVVQAPVVDAPFFDPVDIEVMVDPTIEPFISEEPEPEIGLLRRKLERNNMAKLQAALDKLGVEAPAKKSEMIEAILERTFG